MRRLAGGLLLVALALASGAARAETAWTCEVDGRIGGDPSGLCRTTLDPGSYRIEIAGLNRESSGELRLSVGDGFAAVCEVAAGLWRCDDDTSGSGPAGQWPAFDVETVEAAELAFQIAPLFCGTLTCGRDPQIITGRFRLSATAVDG